MRKTALSLPLLTIFAASAASAQPWSLIDDWQGYADMEIYSDATEIGWFALSNTGSDAYEFFADPDPGAPDNIAMYMNSGDFGSPFFSTTWAYKEIPDGGVGVDQTATIYFRYLESGSSNNLHVGTCDRPRVIDDEVDPPAVISQPGSGGWGDYSVLIRMAESGNLEHRDGGGYVSTDPAITFEPGAWNEFWMVIHNTFVETEGVWASTGTYELYMAGPGEEPTLVPVGNFDPVRESANFRRAPLGAPEDLDAGLPRPLIWFMIATNSGDATPNQGDPFLLDDIHFSTGSNLSRPGDAPPTWRGYPTELVDGNTWANTGDWMGWVYVQDDPFVYILDLDTWAFISEADSPSGAWLYFFR